MSTQLATQRGISNGLRPPEITSCAQQLHVFVLVDALGWQFIQKRDFLQDVLPYRTPLRTVLGFSSGAIPTILTGLPPARTGHWNLFYYDPQGSPFRWVRSVAFLPDRVLDHRVTRKVLKELGRRVLGLGPLFECCVCPRLLPLFNWVERRSIYERGGIAGAPSIFDHLAEAGVPYRVYSYHQGSDRGLLHLVHQDLRRSAARFLFLSLSELDHFLHDHCASAGEVESRLNWYAAQLRELFEAARSLDPNAGFTVFSDHGMTPVRHHYDLVREVEALGFTMPRDYLAVYDSTMARFWFFADSARRKISEYLHTVPCGRILSSGELAELGVLFSDARFGEVVFLLHPGWLLSSSDFNGAGWIPEGMHGYHPADPYSDAVFLSNWKPAAELRTIADVYWCMRQAAQG